VLQKKNIPDSNKLKMIENENIEWISFSVNVWFLHNSLFQFQNRSNKLKKLTKTLTNATIPNSLGVRSLAKIAPIKIEMKTPLYFARAV